MDRSYAPGERVLVRDEVWRVRASRAITDTATLLELQPVDRSGRDLSVCVPPDEVARLPSETASLSANAVSSFSHWVCTHGVLASSLVRDVALLSGSRFGRVSIEAYQLAPALRVLRKPRPSLLVADDVGLGKTIEAGLVMLELIARRRADRILIVAPPGLLLQWGSELREKFDLEFALIENAAGLAREQTELPAGVNSWDALPRVLTSVDYIKKDTVRRRALLKRWDLIVVDEAHSLAEAGTDRCPYRTQRTRLGTALRDAARGLLLLTATPHNGHSHSFRSLLELVEPSLATFHGAPEDRVRRIEQARIRRLKSQITRRSASGAEEPVFPPRRVRGIPVQLDARRAELFAKVSSYCSRTARSAATSDDQELVAFAMQIVKKRALSSRAAFEATVSHRLEALRKKENEPKPERAEVREYQSDLPMSEAAAERTAVRILRASVPADEKRRKAEVSALNAIRRLLKGLPDGDPKLDRLAQEVASNCEGEPNAKVIVFTEYLDTLASIRATFDAVPALRGRTVELRGGMSPRQRLRVQEKFDEPGTSVMLATDAASEGLNLQRNCHRVFHVELPWNPNRLEQRNGRVDRYGQTREPEIRYLYYPSSPEEDVLHRLVERIEAMQRDRISTPDILGVLSGTDILDRGLVDLDAESPQVETRKSQLVKVFEDRTAEFVRDVQPLIAGRGDVRAEIDSILAQLGRAHPLVADDAKMQALVAGVIGRDRIRPTDVEGIVRVEVPARFQGQRVAAVYPRATFLRSVAVRFRAADVEFITAAHPLVRALADDARRRVLHVYTGDRGVAPRRIAVRRVASPEVASAVFTFLVAIEDDESTIQEELLAVRVDAAGRVLASGDDAVRWIDPDATPGEVPFELVHRTFAPSFDAMTGGARGASEQALAARVNALRESRRRQSALLRQELERDLADRLFEIDEDERRARASVDAEGQGLLFARSSMATPSLEARREAARGFAESRIEDARRFERIRDPARPRPLGVLFLVPEDAR